VIAAAIQPHVVTDMDRRWILAALVAWAALAGAAGRGREASPGDSRGAKRPVIAVIPKGTTHEYWKGVHAGALKAGEELGVEILWQGPVKEDDREEQIKVVDMIRDRAVSGILLAPLDDKALRGPARFWASADWSARGAPSCFAPSSASTRSGAARFGCARWRHPPRRGAASPRASVC
jgi:ABC-type sugar transport system substrate-binding protein